MNFVFICDSNYIMPTMVAIKSIYDNTIIKENIFFHIITTDMTFEREKELKNIIKGNKIIVHKVNFSDYNKINQINTYSHVTCTALLKFEIANILKKLDKVLYLDSDIIVNGDLSELFEMDMENYYVAAVQELWKYINKSSQEQNGEHYFNSGVLMLNLKLLRQDKVADTLWRKKNELLQNPKYKAMDQDTLNIVLQNKCKFLSLKYNFNPYFGKKKFIDIINFYENQKINNILDFINDVKIFHYVGKEDKPWIYSSAKMEHLWSKYYKDLFGDIDKLERKTINKGLFYYLNLFIRSISEDGLNKTIRRVINKLN